MTEVTSLVSMQTLSNGERITCFTINPEHGSRLSYRLNLIDIPGFGNFSGLQHDQEIVEQIRQFISGDGADRISYIDAVCFIVKASDVRSTPYQIYIFNSIMSLFGKDIESNICSLITFADGIDLPVLAALRDNQIPFGNHFTFNNTGLFLKNSKSTDFTLSQKLWDMTFQSCIAFFSHLDKIQTRSLQLTKDVLAERLRLECTIKNLQPKIEILPSKVDRIKQEIRILDDIKIRIEDNKNFTNQVTQISQRKIHLPNGVTAMTCMATYYTCHENCRCADREKGKCWAMNPNGYCRICPDKCHWTRHGNMPYIFEYLEVKREMTNAEKHTKYQEATGKLLSQEQILDQMGAEIEEICVDIKEMMEVVKTCNDRLKEKALRHDPLSITEHIDKMMEAEKLEKKPGYMNRINVLNEFRKRARVMTDAESFCKDARNALGFVAQAGKIKEARDLKVLANRMKSWFT